MARIKVGEVVRLMSRPLFVSDYEKSDAVVSKIERFDDPRTPFLLYYLEGLEKPFTQGGEDWQQSNEWRDRFYEFPIELGGKYFTRK